MSPVSVEDVYAALTELSDLLPLDTSARDDDEETVGDWWAPVRDCDLAHLAAAVRDWASANTRWPTRSEWAAAVAEAAGQARRAEAIRRGMERPRPDTVCPECGFRPGSPGVHFVEEDDPERPRMSVARPCSLCEPDLYERFLDGHYPPHGLGECSDETCQAYAKKGRGRRAG